MDISPCQHGAEACSSHGTPSDKQNCGRGIVRLNVGGTPMMVSRATFDIAPAGSLARLMFGTDADAQWEPVRLDDGAYFVDLNARWFQVVVDVLRHGESALAAVSAKDRVGAACVADYLGITISADARTVVGVTPDQSDRPAILTVAVAQPSALAQGTRDLWDSTTVRAIQTSHVKHIHIPIDTTLCLLRGMLAEASGLCADTLVAHLCRRRNNCTLRPDMRLPLGSTAMTIGDAYQGWKTLLVLVHDLSCVPKVTQVPHACAVALCPDDRLVRRLAIEQPPGYVLVFVRHLDREAATLSPPRPLVVHEDMSVRAALPELCAAVGVARPDNADLVVFEEIKDDLVEPVDVGGTFRDAEISYGDLLWIEWSPAGVAPRRKCIDQSLLARLTLLAH